MIECWRTDRGGFILSDYEDDMAIGTTPEKIKKIPEAFVRYDR